MAVRPSLPEAYHRPGTAGGLLTTAVFLAASSKIRPLGAARARGDGRMRAKGRDPDPGEGPI